MSSNNRRDLRATDPVLSNVVLSYAQPHLIGHHLFPRVPVDKASGKIIQFGKEAFRLVNTQRAPGSDRKRIIVGHEAGNYSLTNNGLDAQVPVEWLRDTADLPSVNMQSQAVQTVMRIELNNLEYEQATIARNPLNYGPNNKMSLSGSDKWNDYANSNPITDVKEAKEAIRQSTGQYPNKMVIPSKTHSILCEHPKMLAKLADSEVKILTEENYQIIFGIENVVIGGSMLTNETEEFQDVWDNDVILAVVPMSATSRSEPSYGYTYHLRGHPMAERMWYDQSCDSYISGVNYERQALLTGMNAGFLIAGAT